jgi:multidrug efflux pump subunit AcrB
VPVARTGDGGAGRLGAAASPEVSPTIELRQVARPVFGTGPSEISRLNRQRYIAVSGTP